MSATDADHPELLQSEQDGVLTLRLNRAGADNCLSDALVAELHRAFDAVSGRDDIGAVVITATGESFCGGRDFAEYRRRADAAAERIACLASNDMMLALGACPKATIASIRGRVVGAGLEFLLHCDLALAATDATFACQGIDIGLWDHTAQVALSRLLSRKHAMELLLTGSAIAAADALRMGLVNRVVPAAELDAQTTALARAIAGKSSRTITLGKYSYDTQAYLEVAEAYEFVADQYQRDVASEDAREGIAAALAGRAPRWHER